MKNSSLLLVICVLLAAMSVQSVQAQSVVTGTVKDQGGEGLIGVNILVQGGTEGTVTDFDGNYRLEVPNDAVLVFSYIGFLTQEVAVSNRSVVDVTMNLDVEQLDEVVVVGYGSQRKRENVAC